jgi:polygalacturonase
MIGMTTSMATAATPASDPAGRHVSIRDYGAVGDGATLDTAKIQSAIYAVAAQGGGTVVVPSGVFESGAVFMRPGVNLQLDRGAVLRCSTDMANFPEQRTRIEGHFEDHFNPGLINAKGCDGLHITGEGTLDGAGRPIWDEFWKRRHVSGKEEEFKNLSVRRARLCIIERSKGVVVDGVTFKDSQFWNLHLYRCQDALVQNARFTVPDDYKQAPSTDGIDVDSCQGVTVKGCYFSVTDDCIALKGSKGPAALDDKDSPPVEHIRVQDCTYRRGNGVITLGSEATVVRDVVVENCRVIGPVTVATIKLRPDTPQHYEDIHIRGITLDSPTGTIVSMAPWKQYFDLKGQTPPHSTVTNVTLSDIKGRFGSLGTLEGNPGQTDISDVTLERIDVTLTSDKFKTEGVANLKFLNVTVNGKPFTR